MGSGVRSLGQSAGGRGFTASRGIDAGSKGARAMRDDPTPETAQGVLRIRRLWKRYAIGRSSLTALRNLTFEIRRPGVTLLLGPAGSGKTTLLRCIAGIAPQSSGAVVYADHSDRQLAVPASLGATFSYVPRDGRSLHARLSARENIGWAAMVCGASDRTRQTIERLAPVARILKRRRPARLLFPGQKQVLCMAMALVQEPDFCLLDEPTGGLDAGAAAEVLDLVRAATAAGAGVVIATRDPSLQAIADQVVSLAGGRITANQG
jgi:putative ABC transport system ATP-binding protein